MEMNDLFGALDRFDKGVKTLQLQRSLEQANGQIEQIRNSELDSSKQQQALRDVAQGLTFQLAASGTPATTIEALTKSFQGEEVKAPTSFEQAILSGDPTFQKRALQGMQIKDDLSAAAQERAARAAEERATKAEERKTAREDRQRQIMGLGLATNKEVANRIQKEYPIAVNGIESLDKLINEYGPMDAFSPKRKAEAAALAKAVQGLLRTQLIGSGAPSDFDQKRLEDIIKDPGSFLNAAGEAVFGSTKAALNKIKESVESSLKLSLQSSMSTLNPTNPTIKRILGVQEEKDANSNDTKKPIGTFITPVRE
jgi:hypothetical protein